MPTLLALLAGFSLVHATTLNILPRIFREEPKGPPPAETLPRLYSQNPGQAQINACLVSQCGPASTNWTAYNVNERPGLNLEPDRIWDRDFAPWLRRLVEEEHVNHAYVWQRSGEALASGQTIKTGHPVQAIIAFFKVFPYLDSHLDEVLELQNGAYTVREDKLEQLLPQLPGPEHRVAASLLVHTTLKDIANIVQVFSDNAGLNALMVRLQYKYPRMDLRQAQIQDSLALSAAEQRVRQLLGPYLQQVVASPLFDILLERAKHGDDFSKAESERYVLGARSVEMFDAIFAEPLYSLLMNIPMNFEEDLQKLRASRYGEKEQIRLQNENSADRIQSVSDFCKPRLATSLNLSASALDIRQLPPLIAEVKKAALKVALNYDDEDQRSMLATALEKTQFALPEDRAHALDGMRMAFRTSQGANQLGDVVRSHHGPEIDEVLLMVMLISSLNPDDPEDLKWGNELSIITTCRLLPMDTISDLTLTSLNKISVSWFAANYPSAGIAIMAHEMGHVVSHVLRLQQEIGAANTGFTSALSCVANRNPFVMKPVSLLGYNNTQWSEEDWADHFSSAVMDELKRAHNVYASDRNQGCALLQVAGGEYQESALDPWPGDVHSSGLLRVLFTAQDRGTLTPQCQPLLDYAKLAGRPLTCR